MTSRRRFLRDALGIVAGAGLLGLPVWSWLANREPVARFARTMMGTKVEIVLVGLTPAAAAAAAELAFAEMARVERRLTIFDSRSALSRLNAGAGSGPVPIDPDLSAVLTRAEAIRNVSGKVFTPAALPLTRLWDPSRRRIPDPAAVERAREAVQRARLILAETGGAALGPGTQLDLGGIAKGYAVDLAVGALRRRGVESGIVDAGGDLRLLGSRMGRPWPVGIPDPSHPELIARVLNLRDAAVATSGDYERFFLVDGVRYHHLIDPRTGYPAREARSFTVVIPDGTSADAASTAGFVLGPEAGLEFVVRLGGQAVAMDASGRWVESPSLGTLEG